MRYIVYNLGRAEASESDQCRNKRGGIGRERVSICGFGNCIDVECQAGYVYVVYVC